ISGQVRQALLREGYEAHVAAFDRAEGHFGHAPPELLVVVLSPNPERALGGLSELRPLTRARLLAVGPANDPRLVLQSLRAGADASLDGAEAGAEVVAATARKRTGEAQPAPAETGRVIAVLAPSGGCGASTLAANVATALAHEHKRAALLD